jgi:ABC-type branched-subunit amino acid transport system substrate-binding protein
MEEEMKPRITFRKLALIVALASVGVAVFLAVTTTARGNTNSVVVLSHGQSVELALVLDPFGLSDISTSVGNAVRMAEQLTPSIDGFHVQVVNYGAPCFSDDNVAANAAVASAVVSDPHTVAVIGHLCSVAFSGLPDPDALPCESPSFPNALSIYESAGVPTISGSATGDCLPSVGPSMFNRTAIADSNFDSWYSQVTALPSDVRWRAMYAHEFGSPPSDFADLYFDATRILLSRIAQVAHVQHGNLVIDRAVLAATIRATTGFSGVTGSITIDPATGNRLP